MSDQDDGTIKDAIMGIDTSLFRISESLEQIAGYLDDIVGKTGKAYGEQSFIRTMDIGD